MYMAPDQCLRQTGFTNPKKSSPVIAYITNDDDDGI